MKKTLSITAVVALALLSGCASFQQGLNAYESAALSGARASNDNLIQVWTVAACATPFSAAVRNPQIIPALRALCVPGIADTSPASLLDGISRAPAAPAK
jgi:hypothetical protein